MKKVFWSAAFWVVMGSCHEQPRTGGNAEKAAGHAYTPPSAGTIVAADSMPFTKDPLNHYYFSVKLRVSGENGRPDNYAMVYDVLAGYGPAQAQSTIAMPRGGRDLQPLLRKDDSSEYSYIIGFIPSREHGGDSTFKPYYRVSAQRGEISIKALKSYVFM